MSGHSKWATTKRRKFTVDAKKSSIFTKLANNITIMARAGGEPTMNFGLRMAIDKARSFNVPKENIERAIKKGTGELAGAEIHEEIYECFGPGGAALVIEVLTDNRNRSANEIRQTLSECGGSLSGPGSVMWQFERKGVIRLTTNNQRPTTDQEGFELKLIELGADNWEIAEEGVTVYTNINNLQKLKESLEKEGFVIETVQPEYVPKEKMPLPAEKKEQLEKMLAALDELDGVNEYYTNAEL